MKAQLNTVNSKVNKLQLQLEMANREFKVLQND